MSEFIITGKNRVSDKLAYFSVDDLGRLKEEAGFGFGQSQRWYPGKQAVVLNNGSADLNLSFTSAGAGGSYSIDTVNKQFSATPYALAPGPAGATTSLTVDLPTAQQFYWDTDTVFGVLVYVEDPMAQTQLQIFPSIIAQRQLARYNGTLQQDWGFSDQPGWFFVTGTGDRYGFTNTNRTIQNGVLPNTTGGVNLLLNSTTPVDTIRFAVTSVANNNIGTVPVTLDSFWINPRGEAQVPLMFDDCWATEYDAIEYLARNGLKGTIGVTRTLVGTANYMTEAQLVELYNLGWDLVNHGNTHFSAHAKSANSICASQTPVAGNLALNGAVGSTTFDAPRLLVINPTGNESGRPFTVTGLGEFGEAQTEVLYGGNVVRTVSRKVWTKVTQISIPSNAAAALTVGTSYSEQEVYDEYRLCKEYLLSKGWTRGSKLVIYPTGSYNVLVRRALDRLGFTMGRITSGNVHYAYPAMPGFRPFEIPCWGGGGSTQALTGYGVAGGFNTGNGTMSTPTFPVGAPFSDWLITFTAATTFDVTNFETGAQIGSGSTGSAFTKNGVSFTITAGGTPFVAGDTFRAVVCTQHHVVLKECIRRGAACILYWHAIIRSGAVSSTQMVRADYRSIVDEIAKEVRAGRVKCPTFSEFAEVCGYDSQ